MTDQIFLSYAHEDLTKVKQLYDDLTAAGLNVWLDKAKLRPGKWKHQIRKAIPRSRYFLLCLSQHALRKVGDDKPGFIDTELQQAYEIADAQDERSFTIVPVLLENCDRGDHRVSVWQQYDLYEDWESGVARLAEVLGGRPKQSEEDQFLASLLGKAEAKYYASDYKAALELLDLVVEYGGASAEVWFQRGYCLDELGRYEEALVSSEEALRIKPDYASAWHNKGNALNELGRYEEALVSSEEALRIKPDHGPGEKRHQT